MSEKVFKRNRTILLKIFKQYIPVYSEDQLFDFLANIRNMTKLHRRIYSVEQLENIFLFELIPLMGA